MAQEPPRTSARFRKVGPKRCRAPLAGTAPGGTAGLSSSGTRRTVRASIDTGQRRSNVCQVVKEPERTKVHRRMYRTAGRISRPRIGRTKLKAESWSEGDGPAIRPLASEHRKQRRAASRLGRARRAPPLPARVLGGARYARPTLPLAESGAGLPRIDSCNRLVPGSSRGGIAAESEAILRTGITFTEWQEPERNPKPELCDPWLAQI